MSNPTALACLRVWYITTIHRQSNMADTVVVGIEIEIIKHLFAVPKSKLHPLIGCIEHVLKM